ncbi:MAG: four helix bundle protein [Ignavibacteria bacterium]|nr:four helix bundle protein [Ignavibacteria bacterium]
MTDAKAEDIRAYLKNPPESLRAEPRPVRRSGNEGGRGEAKQSQTNTGQGRDCFGKRCLAMTMWAVFEMASRSRTFRFALQIISIAEKLPDTVAARIMGKQLTRSGTSIGANVEEATGAHSKADFIYRTYVALREARETLYWLRLLKASHISETSIADEILREADEITRILGAIVSSARGKRKT